ncbi:MAG TPA: type II secretion system protein GspE [Gammaproteobacteria bacterium]|nr:type II secretion system protein GspE [Gammaproteobacteria bacterium]
MSQISDAPAHTGPDKVRPDIPYRFAREHNVLITGIEDGKVVLACPKPLSFDVLSELRRHLNQPLSFKTLPVSEFDALLRSAYSRGHSEATQMAEDLSDEIDLDQLIQDIPQATDLLEEADDAPIIKLINALFNQAIREHASDIHIEAYETHSVVRFRIDGILKNVTNFHRGFHAAVISRLKVMAKLDIAEKRLPQDGRISLRVGDHAIDVRVSTLPTEHGERIVLRILDKQASRFDVAKLGMDEGMEKRFKQLTQALHGMFLVTGPTGSGKTTTLYAGLSHIDCNKRNIVTIEDPVEYDLEGIGQVHVNIKTGLTFARGLRSILRQDPDVVLVGEIRDLETAEIAIQASLTGHLVLSTLHTNTAIGAITRLLDMGVDAYLIASSLTGILAQRLVRKLCPTCREAYEPTGKEREILRLSDTDQVTIYHPQGCDQCHHTGFSGRTGIFELIVVDSAIKNMIHSGESEENILNAVRKTSPSILDNGREKVCKGITSLDEILRVTTYDQ